MEITLGPPSTMRHTKGTPWPRPGTYSKNSHSFHSSIYYWTVTLSKITQQNLKCKVESEHVDVMCEQTKPEEGGSEVSGDSWASLCCPCLIRAPGIGWQREAHRSQRSSPSTCPTRPWLTRTRYGGWNMLAVQRRALCDLRVLIFCKEMCFSSSRRSLTSEPYFPQVPLSVRMKCEWLLLSTASLLSGLAIVW